MAYPASSTLKKRRTGATLLGLGRDSYVSQSGITSLINAVAKDGIPSAKSQRSQYRDRNLLVIDDVSDGGSTFDFVVGRIRQRTNYKVYTAAPYIKTGTKFIPDFYVTEIPKDKCLVFPFELSKI